MKRYRIAAVVSGALMGMASQAHAQVHALNDQPFPAASQYRYDHNNAPAAQLPAPQPLAKPTVPSVPVSAGLRIIPESGNPKAAVNPVALEEGASGEAGQAKFKMAAYVKPKPRLHKPVAPIVWRPVDTAISATPYKPASAPGQPTWRQRTANQPLAQQKKQAAAERKRALRLQQQAKQASKQAAIQRERALQLQKQANQANKRALMRQQLVMAEQQRVKQLQKQAAQLRRQNLLKQRQQRLALLKKQRQQQRLKQQAQQQARQQQLRRQAQWRIRQQRQQPTGSQPSSRVVTHPQASRQASQAKIWYQPKIPAHYQPMRHIPQQPMWYSPKVPAKYQGTLSGTQKGGSSAEQQARQLLAQQRAHRQQMLALRQQQATRTVPVQGVAGRVAPAQSHSAQQAQQRAQQQRLLQQRRVQQQRLQRQRLQQQRQRQAQQRAQQQRLQQQRQGQTQQHARQQAGRTAVTPAQSGATRAQQAQLSQLQQQQLLLMQAMQQNNMYNTLAGAIRDQGAMHVRNINEMSAIQGCAITGNCRVVRR
ncbi:MAG: hypothetical protein CR991_03405 [Proteobacteria bacterium]|nr:MAG: hypothetical protein CR991_03405 [Pseudomonadota bacterium]